MSTQGTDLSGMCQRQNLDGLAIDDIVKGSGYITRQCCGSTEIELGTVYAAELGISLFSDIDRYTLEGAEVKLYFHLYLADGTVESIPMGVFEVSEANRNIKTLELKAYDYMLRFDKALSLNATSGTAFNYLAAACSACKVELAQTQAQIEALPNGKETLGVYAENDMETYRDLLFYVGQVLGCVCLINREGKLQLVPYSDTAVMTIPQKGRYETGYLLASHLIDHNVPVTAFAAMNDTVAYGVIDAIVERGKRVPQDYSVCGCDNLPSSAYQKISLTTVEPYITEKARDAVDLLARKIRAKGNGGRKKGPVSITRIEYEPQLIVRKSTGRCMDKNRD